MTTERTRIEFTSGASEELPVTRVDDRLFRLEQSSSLSEARYHDVIEVDALADGLLRFVRIAQPSGAQTIACRLPEKFLGGAAHLSLLDDVKLLGGAWEETADGMLLLHVDPEFAPELEERVRELSAG